VVHEGWKCWRLYHHLLLVPLFAEGSSAHLEHGFEALAAFNGVLLELRDGRLLHGILDLLPSSAHSRDLCLLLELCLGIRGRSIDDGFLNGDEIRKGEVGRAHCHLLCLEIDIGRLKDMRCLVPTHHREEPFRCRLLASYESLSPKLTRC